MVLLFWFMIRLLGAMPTQPVLFTMTGSAQGTTYSIKYLAREALVSQHSVDSIFMAIDLSLSLYQPSSLINRFNSSGVIRMDEHMRNVVTAAIAIHQQSEGGFDITTRPVSLLWGFGSNGEKRVPSKKEIRRTLKLVGTDKIFMRNDSLIATRKGVQIDCNGIAQGYTVDVLSHYLKAKGAVDHLVELGGEVRGSGTNAEQQLWQVGIESASPIAGDWRTAQKILSLHNRAVTTSGDYKNYFTNKGKRYTHIIDPKNGRPVNNSIIAVTVIAADAMTADAWDNGFFVMGVERSFKKLAGMSGVEAYFIYEDSKGNIRDTATKEFYKMVR